MSSTAVSTSSAAAPSTSAVCASIWQTPNEDKNCAMPRTDKNVDYMKKCCKDAQIVSYYNDCGIYCLAVDQTIEDLVDCLHGEGAGDRDVFCRGTGNDTATATDVGSLDPTITASIISGATSSSSSGKDDNSDKEDDKGAAVKGTVSVLGLAIGTLLISAFTIGGI
ncbi:unnamed protein product [Clonostachys rosea f. rosea IK726]|uniref:Uncharacterized protein n=1 Tax=Clonostachys rosea f. rosea IK726 TaxID=1349383 RepID=A0ACA9UQ57_BIOOC|nr:unnamed protein product [Clonostachys rosea f. rosea IK726]